MHLVKLVSAKYTHLINVNIVESFKEYTNINKSMINVNLLISNLYQLEIIFIPNHILIKHFVFFFFFLRYGEKYHKNKRFPYILKTDS